MKWPLFAVVLLPLTAACAPQQDMTTISRGFPDKLKALGTEPFWSLAIDGGAIAYSTVDQPKPVVGRAVRSEEGSALNLAGTLAGRTATVRVVPATCSDGMSDRVYPYAVTVELGTETLRGCAFPPDLVDKAY